VTAAAIDEVRQDAAMPLEIGGRHVAQRDFGARIGPWRSFKEFRDR